MTGADHNSDTRNCGGEVAAYALGALELAEAEGFRAHLESCAVCRDELAAFQQVVDVLPMSAPQHPAGKRLRRRVLDRLEHEPKLEPGGKRSPRSLPLFARLSMPRPALALGAILAVVAGVFIAIKLGTPGTPKTRVFAAQVTGPGSAEVKVTGGRAVLVVRHFAPPPKGQIYEVWLGRQGQPPAPTSALFSVAGNGNREIQVPGNLRGVHVVMVTPEPPGGTRAPTNPAVIRVQLS